jgi:hypothetical protein
MAKSHMPRAGVCPAVARACSAFLLLASTSGCGGPSAATQIGIVPAAPGQGLSANGKSPHAAATPVEIAAADAPATVGSAPAGNSDNRSAETTPNVAAAKGAKLNGRVTFQGSVPKRRVINMSKEAKCIELHGDKQVLDEDLIVSGDGGVKNAFVFVRRGAAKKDYPLPDGPARLDQKGCMYHPRVQGVRVGQKLLVGNDDPVTHNVRSIPVANRAFNFGQPPETEARERIFERAEREIEVQCDIHPWMHAYIFVMDHPFFDVSKDDGTYSIEGLPPGEYALESWHEKLGRRRETITVKDGDLMDVSFVYSR